MDKVELERFIAECEEKLASQPDDRDALYGIAAAMADLGRYEEAIPRLEMLLQSEPNWPEVLDWLGRCFRGLGRLEEARAAFSRAIECCEDPELYAFLGDVLVEMGRANEARAAYEAGLTQTLPFEETGYRLVESLKSLQERR